MTLVDTSVWINHFRYTEEILRALLVRERVVLHPFVLGELAAGNLKDRDATLSSLEELPKAPVATDYEVHRALKTHRLWGRGLSWVDLHIVVSAALGGFELLTADAEMKKAAEALGVTCTKISIQ
jgi:predicted nucleic acid-binding protein